MKKLFVVLIFFIGIALVVLSYRHPWHKLYCETLLPLTTWSPKSEGLLNCSNITQRILPEYSNNITKVIPDEQPGFSIFTTTDGSHPGVFRVSIKRDRPFTFVFPRVNGNDCRVQVFAVRDESKRLIFDLRGNDKGWSPIGQRFLLNLGCVEHGLNNEVFDVVLEFVVTGKWAQVWMLDSLVFF